jgi:hypoxanthine phosphoribosyltransferase
MPEQSRIQVEIAQLFTFAQLHTLIQGNLHKIPRTIDLVVGIPRSGLIPATHIATSLNLPLVTLNDVSHNITLGQIHSGREIQEIEVPEHVLIVDDTSNSGARMTNATKIVLKRWPKVGVTTLVTCSAMNSKFSPNIALLQTSVPRMFAWNMFNHPELTQKIAVDLDGVLCVDPTSKENDDGYKYKRFIKNAQLKCLPNIPVRAIVTGRLEKFRHETENWLRKNEVAYQELYMNDAKSAEDRRRTRVQVGELEVDQISDFKSRVLLQVKPALFVESNTEQARRINAITGIGVYAFDDDRYFG